MKQRVIISTVAAICLLFLLPLPYYTITSLRACKLQNNCTGGAVIAVGSNEFSHPVNITYHRAPLIVAFIVIGFNDRGEYRLIFNKHDHTLRNYIFYSFVAWLIIYEVSDMHDRRTKNHKIARKPSKRPPSHER